MNQWYMDETFRSFLVDKQLTTFDGVWTLEAGWFEPPNHRRGGWSGVSKIVLGEYHHEVLAGFLKRQENHTARSIQHPIHGEATFTREYRMLQYAARHKVAVPRVIAFGERQYQGANQAFLLLQSLENYLPLDVMLNQALEYTQRRRVLRAVGEAISRMHQASILHKALYPKHIFINTSAFELTQNQDRNIKPPVVFIDLEKSKLRRLKLSIALSEFATLFRHSKQWSNKDKLQLLYGYFSLDKSIRQGQLPWLTRKCLYRIFQQAQYLRRE